MAVYCFSNISDRFWNRSTKDGVGPSQVIDYQQIRRISAGNFPVNEVLLITQIFVGFDFVPDFPVTGQDPFKVGDACRTAMSLSNGGEGGI
jgi:hypothetical protein